ncbi:MAG TPA: methyltransferase [Chitinophagaceae bacterium]|nr:methyltransferase [Chitinophagaceae bacterium]
MANDYFRFKEFIIQQDKCSMKVCTDACLFGSLLPVTSKNAESINRVLDIGTGTGLLSLMYAQRNIHTVIDAVEVEEDSFKQATQNFIRSKWNDRLKIFHTDIRNFVPDKKYDLIITNPPFYENELLSTEKNKNIAKHDEGLTLKDLTGIIKKHLAPNGTFAVLLPCHRIKYFEELAAGNNFFAQEKILIRQTPSHNIFRGVLFFNNTNSSTKITEIIIKNNDGNYTEKFSELLKDYYLKL